jgi:hypothetical protein
MKSPRALNCLRPTLHYRREAFDAGLREAGFRVVPQLADPRPGDVLVIWNRYGAGAELADFFEAAGAHVLVAENGWLGKHWRGGEWFALSGGHHAGAGSWAYGGPQRWDAWQVDLAPWRTGGTETVIMGQRSIGEPGIASPRLWAEAVRGRIGGRIRPHPGTGTGTPLAVDLCDAREVATWASGAALQALVLGVPVWHALPQWIGAAASRPLAQHGQAEPLRCDTGRLTMFRRLAWAMWTLAEIRGGAAFRHLLQLEAAPCAC